MTITMQGSWTVSVKSRSAAFAQRFIVAGATSGNGTYDGSLTTTPVAVTGPSWTLSVENNPGTGWIASEAQLKFPVLDTSSAPSKIVVDIESNDAGGDEDFDDLVLRCTMPVTDNDFVVYGSASHYDERACIFNPCRRLPWAVIETSAALQAALKHHDLRQLIEKVYPGRIPVGPDPDPIRFRPLVLPIATKAFVPPKAGQETKDTLFLSRPEISNVLSIAKLIDRLRLRCVSAPLAGVALRFQEYDRSAAELSGGPYTGAGPREDLGVCATDRNGNYVFRFTRTADQFVDDALDDATTSEDRHVQSLPDVIVQLMGSTYETAPSWNVGRLARINLCIPNGAIGRLPAACQGGRAMQAIGNILLVDPNNTFDGAGRITAHSALPNTPRVECAAWTGRLDIFACFTDHPEVKLYSFKWRKAGTANPYQFVDEAYSHLQIAHLGIPGYQGDSVGPRDMTVHTPTGDVAAKVYENIESDPAWVLTHRDRKIVLDTARYAPASDSVELVIEGYDAAGNFVIGDSQVLFIDNTYPDYAIDFVGMGGAGPSDCALFTVYGTDPGAALTARFRANHSSMATYDLRVTRGNSRTAIAVDLDSSAGHTIRLSGRFDSPSRNCHFRGTDDDTAAHDTADDVTAVMTPTAGAWLSGVADLPNAPGTKFCTFIVGLSVTTRLTNGYGTSGVGYGEKQFFFGLQQLPGMPPSP